MPDAPNLSVNLNKVALLRNSRGGSAPDLLAAARLVADLGADGITVHPREDARHITPQDAADIAAMEDIRSGRVEYNIEGDMRAQLVSLVESLAPTQYTVVPTRPGELTSERGLRARDDLELLRAVIRRLKPRIRMAVFCDANATSVELAAQAECDAVELHTGPYARHAAGSPQARAAIEELAAAAARARSLGLRVHGGHDLTLENLPPLLQAVQFDELSIGHHIAATALLRGMESVTRDYLACVRGSAKKE